MDQLSTLDDDHDVRISSKKDKRDGRKKKDARRKKSREYSSDSDDRSGSSDENKKKKRGKRKDRAMDDSSESEEFGKSEREKKKKSGKEFADDDDGDLSQARKDLARKEMGLEWMLGSGRKNASTDRPVTASKDDCQQEEPQIREASANPRELNPYYRNNGSGYPVEVSPELVGKPQLLSPSVVGDGGASWRLKALKRAREQAAREGRKLDEVVEERWGSLGQLAASVSSRRAAPTHAHLHAIKDRRTGNSEISGTNLDSESNASTRKGQNNRDYLQGVSSRNLLMKKPKQDSLHWKKNRTQTLSQENSSLISSAISGINKFNNDGSFLESISNLRNKEKSPAKKEESDHGEYDIGSSSKRKVASGDFINTQGLSANQLAAKVLQLRMKGRHEEAEQLSKQMEVINDKPDAGNKINRETERNASSRYYEKQMSSERKRREEDADLHLAQTIMKDKKYSISGSMDDEYDYDGVAPSKKSGRKKEKMSDEKQLKVPRHFLTQQERCQFCFESPSRPKHLVVSIGNLTYMTLPQFLPVVQGHCRILPMQHELSFRMVDKNVVEELRNFKKCLLKMFAAEEKDVLFLETVINLSKQRRHCLIECIPIPYAIAKQAPMYFKKAIDEAEDEWGQHEMKKVIPTNGNLRNVIPENFSYFHVEFGLDRGFVHVIDDDSNFSSSFGLNIVRGMLRLPEEDMHRRSQFESIERQKQAVVAFAKQWEPFDWTKDLD